MPDSPSTPIDGIKPEEQQGIPDSGATSEPEWIKLNPEALTEEIRRLQKENPKFLEVFNTEVGNHAQKQAARKWEPEVKKLQSELESERMQRRRLEILSMPEKDIETKFASDPVFAKEYAELVHYTPKQVEDDDPTPFIRQSWENLETWARDQGVDDTFVDKILEKAQQGGYATDGHWSLGMQMIQQDFTNEVLRIKSTSPTTDPKINPSLVNGSAVVTPAGRGQSGGWSFKSRQEFQKLSESQQREILDDPEGLKYVEELVKKG
jgi:hypothetical protein